MAMLFGTTSSYDCDSTVFDSAQYKAARLVTRAIKGISSATLYKELAGTLLAAEGNCTL